MSFDVPSRWESEIKEIAQSRHLAADEVLERVLEAGLEQVRLDAGGPPRRSVNRPPDLRVAEEMPIFGITADKPEFSAEIEKIVAGRENRYANFA